MDKIIFTFTYLRPTDPPGAGPDIFTEIKSSDCKDLPAFFKGYIKKCEAGFNPNLTVDPVIDISVFIDMVKKCFNSISWAQDTLAETQNRLVNIQEELIKYAKIHDERTK